MAWCISPAVIAGAGIPGSPTPNIWPLPKNLGDLLAGFDQVVVPEMNNGQLLTVLRSEYLIDAQGINKVTGQPFTIAELEEAVRPRLRG